MPNITGEYQQLYITRDGGTTFERLNIIDSNIYDFYELPTFEDGIIKLEINQGTDGDYNGGDYKEYFSKDYGKNWNIIDNNQHLKDK